MNLEVNISQRAAEWLEQKARAAGTDESAAAAKLLEELAEREQNGNGSHALSSSDWAREFDTWTQALPRCGGRADARRDTIYD